MVAQLNGLTEDRPARTGWSFHPNLIGPNLAGMIRIHIASKSREAGAYRMALLLCWTFLVQFGEKIKLKIQQQRSKNFSVAWLPVGRSVEEYRTHC